MAGSWKRGLTGPKREPPTPLPPTTRASAGAFDDDDDDDDDAAEEERAAALCIGWSGRRGAAVGTVFWTRAAGGGAATGTLTIAAPLSKRSTGIVLPISHSQLPIWRLPPSFSASSPGRHGLVKTVPPFSSWSTIFLPGDRTRKPSREPSFFFLGLQ